jgi:hypothetical protein
VVGHLREEHRAAAFDDGRARAFVARAYGLEYAAPYPPGSDGGPDEGFGPEPY